MDPIEREREKLEEQARIRAERAEHDARVEAVRGQVLDEARGVGVRAPEAPAQPAVPPLPAPMDPSAPVDPPSVARGHLNEARIALLVAAPLVLVVGLAVALVRQQAAREREREREVARAEADRQEREWIAEQERAAAVAKRKRDAERAAELEREERARRERESERAAREAQERAERERQEQERAAREQAEREATAERARLQEERQRQAEAEQERGREAEEQARRQRAVDGLPEVRLARAEAGPDATITPNHPRVRFFADALDRLATRAVEDRTSIADVLLATVAHAREAGWLVSHEGLLRDAEASLGRGARGSVQAFALRYLRDVTPTGASAPITIERSELGDFDVGEVRVYSDHYWRVTGQVLNKGGRRYRYVRLAVEFCDALGGVIEVGSFVLSDVAPGSQRGEECYGPRSEHDVRKVRIRLDHAR